MNLGSIESAISLNTVEEVEVVDSPQPVTALKTCAVRFGNARIDLVKGGEISGLTQEEVEYLKANKFVK